MSGVLEEENFESPDLPSTRKKRRRNDLSTLTSNWRDEQYQNVSQTEEYWLNKRARIEPLLTAVPCFKKALHAAKKSWNQKR